MVSRLYRMQTKQESSNQEAAEWSPKQAAKTKEMSPRILHNPREYLKHLLCPCYKRFKCCSTDRVEKGFEIGRTYLSRETNIVSIVKSIRYFNHAIELLLSKEQRFKLKYQSRFLTIDPELEPE